MAGTPGRPPPQPNKQAPDGSPRRVQRSRQPQQPPQQSRKIPNSGIVPTALTAAFDHPAIATAIRKFVFETMQKGIIGLRREFAILRQTPDQNPKVPIDSTTASKFRYKDVFCTDKSRVILTFLPNFGDFIHANWLKSELMENSFICCQGPLLDSTGDFWRMIYQERVFHIFMLCRCEEGGKAKCHQYWPKNVGETLVFYGLITVRNDGVVEGDSDISTTNLTLTYNGDIRKIEHRQWQTWPDKSVPRNPVPAFKLLHIARNSRYPVCVHCSAGIGRTGTLVALELVQRNFMHAIEPSIPAIVQEMRSQRAQAVQTEDQLVWIYFVMLGKLCYHGLMAQQDYKIFHAEYEDYIRAMGGQQPIQPSFPKENVQIQVPSAENATQPPAAKGTPRRRTRTSRAKKQQSSSKDEENGMILLGPSAAATSSTPPTKLSVAGGSTSSSAMDVQQQQVARRRSAPANATSSNNRGEPKSQRRRRKAKEVSKRQAENLVPAQVGGRMAGAEEVAPSQHRNYQTSSQPRRQMQSTQLPPSSKQDEEGSGGEVTARSEHPTQKVIKPSSCEKPQSCEDYNNNTNNTYSAENLRRKSDEDAQPKSVFLQPNLASEQKKHFFATSKPIPNGPAPTRDDNSYYLDAPDEAPKPANFDDNGYFGAPKK